MRVFGFSDDGICRLAGFGVYASLLVLLAKA
jgi:hypothetical protein